MSLGLSIPPGGSSTHFELSARYAYGSLALGMELQKVRQKMQVETTKRDIIRMASHHIGLSFMSNKRRKTAGTGSLLASECRRILSLLEGRPIAEHDIAKDENGRPYFQDHHSDFSISHSGNMCAVSLVNDKNMRTGCDIQLVRPGVKIGDIAEKFFWPVERKYIFQGDEKRLGEERFFHIWTLKESYIKLLGHSVFGMPKVPSFVGDGYMEHFSFNGDSSLSFYLYDISGSCERYMLAAAVKGEEAARPEIHWFSQPEAPFLPCRIIAVIKAGLSPAEMMIPKM